MPTKRILNFELLRVVAMLMVLCLHANFMTFHHPTMSDSPVSVFLRSEWQSLCLVAVNTFVMISGWFGIRPSIKGFSNFMWQVFYIIGLSVAVEIVIFNVPVTYQLILGCFGLYASGGWFVGAYLALYFVAPFLNGYIKNTSDSKILMSLIAFFVFEVIFGATGVRFVNFGYSPYSFIGLYILSGYLRKKQFRIRPSVAFGLYFLCTAVSGVFTFVIFLTNNITMRDAVLAYTNPLIIAGAAFLLLSFAGIDPAKFERRPWSKIIPWLSTSCFAVYLLHVGTSFMSKMYCNAIRGGFYSHPGIIGGLIVVGIILGVFFGAIIIDKPRVWIWRHVLLRFFDKKVTSKEKEEEAMVG